MFANLDYLIVQQHQSSQNTFLKFSQIGALSSTVNCSQSSLGAPPGVLSQFVRINSTLSDSLLVSYEVPQGAIFSPFCYTWMTFPSPRKNVALNLTSMTRTFTYRFLDSATAVTKLEQDLHRVATWCCETHLLINPAKTKFVLIAWANFKKTTRELVCVLSGKISWTCYFSQSLGRHLRPPLNLYDIHISNL